MLGSMHSRDTYDQVRTLIAEGLDSSEISRRTGLPRSTVRYWRTGQPTIRTPDAGRLCQGDCEAVLRQRWFGDIYALLFGHYLGDGTIDIGERGVARLRVTCTAGYVDIINDVASAMCVVRGVDKVGFVRRAGCVDVVASWKHWACVFPQHGPGRKHEREIRLRPWQESIVDRHAEDLVRGLFHSDGCRAINRVSAASPTGRRTYEYVRYQFTNASRDILGICTAALERLDVGWTRMNARNISVARKADVARLELVVGPKT
jgi:hypothetical protein